MTVWDAVVVGAGPAGLLAGQHLLDSNQRVLVVDCGPRLHPGQKPPEVDRRAWPFTTVRGAWYRVHAVGGRCWLWGGWSYRFPEVALERAGWPLGERDLTPYYERVETTLGVVEGVLDERYRALVRSGLKIAPKRGALWPKQQAWLPLKLRSAQRARVHKRALRLLSSSTQAEGVVVFDLLTEKLRTIRARSFVLAASPLETAAILLKSNLESRAGRGLVDHMVASYVLLEPAPPPPAYGRGPFPGSVLVENFVNVGGDTRRPYRGGFSIEVTGPVKLDTLGIERMVPSDEHDRHRATVIHGIGEMFPHKGRFMELDPDKRDYIGEPVPRIHAAFSAEERRLAADMKKACMQLSDEMALPGSRLIPFVDPLVAGAGHEAGTVPMGVDGKGLVDCWGKLRSMSNVWVADASVMPTAGDRHPTLTMLAHALRCADSVRAYLTSTWDCS